jgi:hypothetical protein
MQNHSVQKMKSDEIKEASYHEAGHWVVARQLGFETGEIKIEIQQRGKDFGHSGSARIVPRLQIDSIKDSIEKYLRNRIAVLFAGVIAQMKFIEKYKKNEETSKMLLGSHGADDHKIIKELLCILRGLLHCNEEPYLDKDKEEEKQNLQLHTECWELSCRIVGEHRDAITILAKKMEEEIQDVNKPYPFSNNDLIGWLSKSSPTSE